MNVEQDLPLVERSDHSIIFFRGYAFNSRFYSIRSETDGNLKMHLEKITLRIIGTPSSLVTNAVVLSFLHELRKKQITKLRETHKQIYLKYFRNNMRQIMQLVASIICLSYLRFL